MSEISEKYHADVEKLLEMGKEKEYLTFDDINRLLPADVNSAEDIEALFDVIGAEGISISDSDEKFIEASANAIEANEDKLSIAFDDETEADTASGEECMLLLEAVPELIDTAMIPFDFNRSDVEQTIAACEFVLEGLYAENKISRNEEGGYSAVTKAKKDRRGMIYDDLSETSNYS